MSEKNTQAEAPSERDNERRHCDTPRPCEYHGCHGKCAALATQPTQAEAPSDWRDTIQGAIDELPYQHYLIPRLTQLLAAQQAERAPMTDEQMRAEWFAAGGEIHGPRIETVTMPESSYFRFRRALATQQAGQGEAVGEVRAKNSSPGIFVQWYAQPPIGSLLYTTPPAPQQPEALAQQERKREPKHRPEPRFGPYDEEDDTSHLMGGGE